MVTISTYRDYEAFVWTMVDAISERHGGHICVAGSYAMLKAVDYMQRFPHPDLERASDSFFSLVDKVYANDVDIWIPMVHQAVNLDPESVRTTPMDARRLIIKDVAEGICPTQLMHTETLSSGEDSTYDVDSTSILGSVAAADINGYLSRIMSSFNTGLSEEYTIKITPPKAEVNGQEAPDPNDYGQWFYMTDGVSVQLKIIYQPTDTTLFTLQLIANNIVPIEHESWAECVVNQFDITSSRVAFVSSDSPPIFGQDALNDILHSEFQYLVKPCMSFKRCWLRMMEYTRKGILQTSC